MILEIGFHPWLRDAFPDEVTWIDTSLRWDDVRSYQKKNGSPTDRLIRLVKQAFRALHLAAAQPYDVVVARCLSTTNTLGCGLHIKCARTILGWFFEWLVLFAARGSRVKLVIIDATDRITIHPRDRRLFQRCGLYFKRELAQNFWHSLESVLPNGACPGAMSATAEGAEMIAKLRPFPLGIRGEMIRAARPMSARRWDVFYVGTESHVPARKALRDVLAQLKQRGWRVYAPTEKLSFEDYLETLAESRCCFSPSGIGWDCLRHYECLSQGTIPLMDHRTLFQLHPLRHAEECFYLDYQTDVAAQVESILQMDNAMLDKISQQGQTALTQYLTFQAVAQQMRAEIDALLHVN